MARTAAWKPGPSNPSRSVADDTAAPARKPGTGLNAEVAPSPADRRGGCRLQVPAALRLDIDAENRALAVNAEQASRHYGMRLGVAECRVYAASIGKDELPYQWCPLELIGPP